MVTLKVKLLDARAELPERATDGSAGLDLATITGFWAIGAFRACTGIAVEIPPGHCGLILPRSSAVKRGILVQGLIDEDYRGEVFVTGVSVNEGERVFVGAGEAIAQLLVVPYARVEVVRADALSATERGSGGFGSTGK